MRFASAILLAAATLALAGGEASANVPVSACKPHYELSNTWNYYGEHVIVTYYIDVACHRSVVRSRPYGGKSPVTVQH